MAEIIKILSSVTVICFYRSCDCDLRSVITILEYRQIAVQNKLLSNYSICFFYIQDMVLNFKLAISN